MQPSTAGRADRPPIPAGRTVRVLATLTAAVTLAGCGYLSPEPRQERQRPPPPEPSAAVSPCGAAATPVDCGAAAAPSGLPGNPVPGYPTGTGPTGGTSFPADRPGGPVDATCPPDAPVAAEILSMARHRAGMRLPDDATVTDRRCAATYLVAALTAPRVGDAIVVLHHGPGGWRAVAVGSYPCMAVPSAPPARDLLGCDDYPHPP